MTNKILIDDTDGSALLVESGNYLLWESEFAIGVPDDRNLYVFSKTTEFEVSEQGGIHVSAASRTFGVSARGSIWVPPRKPPGAAS
jgi:hypothetical protein